jgi:diguanylate cyclase (GGDEF)-like protein
MDVPPSVLIVEGNEGHSYLIEEKFKTAFPQAVIQTTRTLREASQLLPERSWDLVILNSQLPDGRGTDFLNRLSSKQPFAAVAILTENPNEETALRSHHHGTVEFLTKDRHTLESFVDRVKRLVGASRRLTLLMREGKGSGFAFRDPLTNVYSRAYFDDCLKREMSRANQYGQEFSLLIVDVDHFRQINRCQGHPTGDLCLKKLSEVLTRSVRGGDLVARFGHDEFVILLHQCRQTDAVRTATRVLDQVQKTVGKIHFTVSIGAVHYEGTQKVRQPEKILTRAEKALSRAKRQQGNRYVIAA